MPDAEKSSTKRAAFGPGGNSESFYAEGFKHTEQAPAYVAAKGLDAYEYQGGNGINGSPETFAKIGEAAKKAGVFMSLHAPYYISLSSLEPAKRDKSVDYIMQSVAAAELLGADIIVIHTGSAAKIDRATALGYARETIEKALAATAGTKVRLGLETMGKLNQLGTLEEVISLCKADPRLCPVVDFGHLNARLTGQAFKTPDDYRRVFENIGEALGDSYANDLHCHFSKIEYTSAGEKKHLTFADTQFGPDFEPLAGVIAKYNFTPRIICESDGTMAEDACAMKQMYLTALGSSN